MADLLVRFTGGSCLINGNACSKSPSILHTPHHTSRDLKLLQIMVVVSRYVAEEVAFLCHIHRELRCSCSPDTHPYKNPHISRCWGQQAARLHGDAASLLIPLDWILGVKKERPPTPTNMFCAHKKSEEALIKACSRSQEDEDDRSD